MRGWYGARHSDSERRRADPRNNPSVIPGRYGIARICSLRSRKRSGSFSVEARGPRAEVRATRTLAALHRDMAPRRTAAARSTAITKIYAMIHFRHSSVTVAGNIAVMLLDRILLLIALALAAATLALLVVAS